MASRGVMGGGFRLGSILGFEIRIDYSWFIIFFLILWSLSAGFFPQVLPGRDTAVYVAMGVAGALLFFASILAHELSHSIVARARGIPVEGITLFLFGGIAHTRLEAEDPGDEIQIAGIGPLLSFALGGLFWVIGWLGGRIGWPEPVNQVAVYLGFINVLLAVFNLLPGFPLDGGRLFRAIVWKATGDLTKATQWATTGGKALGYGLMGLGLLQMFTGGALGGLWLVFIGWFLRGAAEMSFTQHLIQGALEGVRAAELMSERPETVPPGLTLRELVDEHLLKRRYQSYPVVDGSRLVGLVTLDHVKDAPRERWDSMRVEDVMARADERLVVGPDERMLDVLARMQESGTRRVLVARGGELVGIVSASDITRWVQRARDLGVSPRSLAPS